MVGTRSPRRLGITYNNSHIIMSTRQAPQFWRFWQSNPSGAKTRSRARASECLQGEDGTVHFRNAQIAAVPGRLGERAIRPLADFGDQSRYGRNAPIADPEDIVTDIFHGTSTEYPAFN